MKKLCTMLCILCLAGCQSTVSIQLKDAIVVEYGSEVKVEDLTTDEGATLKEMKELDTKKVEKQTVTAIFTKEEKEIEKQLEIEVKDTKAPTITFKKEELVTITQDDEFDPASNIESIKDPVDGDIKLSEDETITKDGYFITSDVDTVTPGSYTVKVSAYDINGTSNENSYTVTVEEKPVEETPVQAPVQSNTGGTAQTTPQSPAPAPTPEPTPAPTPEPEKPAAVCPAAIYDVNQPCNWMPEKRSGGFQYYYSREEALAAGYAYQKDNPNIGFDVSGDYDNGNNRVYIVVFWEAKFER